MSNYVTIYEEYKHKFFQLPKVFFTNEKYINMSNNAKVAWALLRDRSSLSRKNEWFDKDTGRIYFIFKNKELMNLLNVKSETTLTKIKKELNEMNLIEEIRLGFNKPNKLYLLYPEVQEADIYKIDRLEEYEHGPVEDKKKKEPESLAGQGTPKNGVPKNEVHELQKMEPSNTDTINTSLKDLDTLDTLDTRKIENNSNIFKNYLEDSSAEQERLKQKEQYMNNAFYENEERVPVNIAKMLKVFSSTPEEAKAFYNIIMTAKKNAEISLEGNVIWLEHEPELEKKIINAFSRSIRKIEKERNIDNPKGYIYKSIYDLIIEELKPAYALPTDGIYSYDWLNAK